MPVLVANIKMAPCASRVKLTLHMLTVVAMDVSLHVVCMNMFRIIHVCHVEQERSSLTVNVKHVMWELLHRPQMKAASHVLMAHMPTWMLIGVSMHAII